MIEEGDLLVLCDDQIVFARSYKNGLEFVSIDRLDKPIRDSVDYKKHIKVASKKWKLRKTLPNHAMVIDKFESHSIWQCGTQILIECHAGFMQPTPYDQWLHRNLLTTTSVSGRYCQSKWAQEPKGETVVLGPEAFIEISYSTLTVQEEKFLKSVKDLVSMLDPNCPVSLQFEHSKLVWNTTVSNLNDLQAKFEQYGQLLQHADVIGKATYKLELNSPSVCIKHEFEKNVE